MASTVTSLSTSVLLRKYPAKAHARKVFHHLSEFLSPEKAANGCLYLRGSVLKRWPYSDQDQPMRQNRYFFYLSGVNIPGSHVLYDHLKDKLKLFIPPIDEEDVMWSGLPMSKQEILDTYDFDEVEYSDELNSSLESIKQNSSYDDVFCIEQYEELSKYLSFSEENSTAVLRALDEARMIKDEYELSLMRRASEITDNSHYAVMSALPIEKTEGHIHAEFIYHSMRQGSKHQSYDPICCSGTDCSTLHYVRNDQPLDGKLLVLIDAGAEWNNYASDVTRVFPINGKWTSECRAIYEMVLEMQLSAMNLVKPGVEWDDLHLLTHKILVEHFRKLGIFKKEYSVQEILDSRVSVAFYPHGLGHLLGMDTHDVGGQPNYEDPDELFRYLRLRRPLQENMVVTVEPGCYFSPFILGKYLSQEKYSRYVDFDVLEKYKPVGGVRIEDDVLVTSSGFENLTKITKDADEISSIVKAGIEKGASHFHCVV